MISALIFTKNRVSRKCQVSQPDSCVHAAIASTKSVSVVFGENLRYFGKQCSGKTQQQYVEAAESIMVFVLKIRFCCPVEVLTFSVHLNISEAGFKRME